MTGQNKERVKADINGMFHLDQLFLHWLSNPAPSFKINIKKTPIVQKIAQPEVEAVVLPNGGSLPQTVFGQSAMLKVERREWKSSEII